MLQVLPLVPADATLGRMPLYFVLRPLTVNPIDILSKSHYPLTTSQEQFECNLEDAAR